MRKTFVQVLQAAAIIVGLSGYASARAASGTLDCHVNYSVTSWSVEKKSGTGVGNIRCNDGENMVVRVRLHADGITGGKSHIGSAYGGFTRVRRLDDLLGIYKPGGNGDQAKGGQVMSRGGVTLTLGANELNLTFGDFELVRARTKSS